MNLEKYHQEHLVKYLDTLTENQRESLEKQIANIDFKQLQEILNQTQMNNETQEIKPLRPTRLEPSLSLEYFEKGLETIKKGEVAVILLAGGQGTRLGHDGPKGTYDIGLKSGKSLFNIQCDKLKRLYDLTNTYTHWYIMTSEDNHEETIQHFKDFDYFSYSKEHIHFFKQDRMPLVLANGQVAMKSPFEINLAANGNGGVFSSLASNGIIEEMQANRIKWVYLYGVDNVLAKVADPAFLQFAINSDKDIASKAVDKTEPDEKVGVICYRNNHPDIVEYSELPDDMRYAKDEKGELLYRNGNILQHYFKFDFLKSCVSKSLPYHLAHKKVDHYDDTLLIADQPNGYKFELFMFDVFKYTTDMAVLTVNRNEEFAPVKNKEGNDSPEIARKMIRYLHKAWLAMAKLEMDPDDLDTSSTYMGEGL